MPLCYHGRMNPAPGTPRRITALLRLCMLLFALALLLPAARTAAQSGGNTLYLPVVGKSQVQRVTAVLKWAYGGCYSSWCETGWYSSPAVLDIDGDLELGERLRLRFPLPLHVPGRLRAAERERPLYIAGYEDRAAVRD